MMNEEGAGKGRVRRKGRGQGQQQPGFTRPGGSRVGPRASRASQRPPACPRAACPPGAHAQPGPPLESPAHPRRGRAYVAEGCLAPLRAASRRPGSRRVPPGRALSAAIRTSPRGRGHAGGVARRGQVTCGGRERRRLVAILGGGRLKAGECEGAQGRGPRGEGPAPHDPHTEAESRASPAIVPGGPH